MKVVLITGCSSGFGYLSALTFARNGWHVFATVREIDSRSKNLQKIITKEKLPVEIMQLDVTSDNDVSRVVKKVLKTHKKIDVLINNACFGLLGPIEDFSIQEIQKQYDTNVFGVVRMCQAVLPSMRARKSGRIINISSVVGLISFGFYGVYASSKFAVEALSEALRFEVKPFGVDVTLLEPGSFATNFVKRTIETKQYGTKNSPYKKFQNPSHSLQKPGGLLTHPLALKLRDPQRVADKLFELATIENTKIRYNIGVDTKIYLLARRILPGWLWEKMLHKTFGW